MYADDFTLIADVPARIFWTAESSYEENQLGSWLWK